MVDSLTTSQELPFLFMLAVTCFMLMREQMRRNGTTCITSATAHSAFSF